MEAHGKLLQALSDMTDAQHRAIQAMAEMQTSPEYLSVKDYAHKYSVSKAQVYRLLESGLLPGKRLGSRWIVKIEDE